MKRADFALAVALATYLSGGCRSTRPEQAGTDAVNTAAPAAAHATTPDSCLACNGIWGRHGLAQKEGCLCRTRDAGKICKSRKDCESQCVAKDEPDAEIVDKGPPPKGYFLGKCHGYASFFGCARLLPGSAASGGPVPLDEPPPKICID
jgi:hypothetical protein